jgi:hypothetical protein
VSDLPNPEDEVEVERPYETAEARLGHHPDGGPGLSEDIAQQAAAGQGGPEGEEQAAQQAPASEGKLDG